MGAAIHSDEGRAPLDIAARSGLHAIHYRLPVASAQVKSAILFAALAGDGESRIEDPFGTRDHAERMLPLFGARIEIAGATVALRPGPLAAAEVRVPGDLSAAAFAIAAALLVPGSRLRIPNVGVNPGRDGCLRAFARMGARIARSKERSFGAEPVADLAVESQSLRGIRVPAEEVPRLIDEIPVLLVLAAVAAGETVIEGAGELRYKESDRIETMRAGLEAMGAKIAVRGDDIMVRGGSLSRGGRVSSGGDHRVAMALALAGLVTPQPVRVTEAAWIATSFPDFVATLRAAGIAVRAAA
ncbi:MAG TPA: 3-phosphoshikimate 1-carboxyvinyltransferase, partial [Gammaproteobacteria bacterium]|nr:3-phosphoshikimate 1-carboxyvinyltransferase [Gammaproteobacteria bacterium]